jgi:hypothetical protein
MARQLEAGVVLQAVEPGEIETLLWMLRRRAEAGPVAAPLAAPLVTMAEAYALLQRGRHQEAQGAHARAREAFAALEPSPYRDVMIAHCTLGEAYAGSHSTPPDVDLDALEPALAMMGARLGEGHPSYLRHAIKVARLLGDHDRVEPARRVLGSAIAAVDGEGSPGFDLVRARAERLRLDLEGNGYAGDPTTVAEWSATAEALGARLDALDQGRSLTPRADVYRVREILLAVHSVAEDVDRMARVLQQLWDDAERSSKVADTCDYSSQLLGEATDEKNEASGAILEIEARLRTRCGCEVEDRPERGRSTSSERTSSP